MFRAPLLMIVYVQFILVSTVVLRMSLFWNKRLRIPQKEPGRTRTCTHRSN